jgi:hypothetical protein
VVLVSSRHGSYFASRVTESEVQGFISKAELSGERLAAMLDEER